MKFYLLLFLLLATHTFCQSQTINDIFLSLPKEYSDGLNKAQKEILIADKKLTIEDIDYHLNIYPENGYLKLEQTYNDSKSAYGIFEVCYWNYGNKKLVAYSSIGGSNGGFFQNDFKFFDYENNHLTIKNYNVFKDYTSNIDILMNNIVNDMVIQGLNQEKKDAIRYAALIVHLPRKGKNIELTFQDHELIENHYSQYISKTKLTLYWNSDGSFHK